MGDRNVFPPEVANDINEALTELQNIDDNTDEVEEKLDSAISELQDIDANTDEIEADLETIIDRLQAGDTQVVEGTVTTTIERFRLFSGQYYEQFELFEDVADGETANYFIRLPDDGGSTVMEITTITLQTLGKVNVTTTENVTVDTQGTQLPVRNKDVSVTEVNDGEIFRGGEYSGGEDPMEYTVPASTGTQAIGSTTETDLTLVPEGNNFLIELFNDAGRTTDISVQTEFIEAERLS